MKKSDLRVIIGGLADDSLREEPEFVSAYATNSRLMGVVAIYIRWDIGGEDFHQFFYVETTEIGIESYRSIRGADGGDVFEAEQAIIGGLGADKIDLSEREARLLVRESVKYSEKFGERLPEDVMPIDFILHPDIPPADAVELETLFAKICVKPAVDFELINYFLMRYYASDSDAVKFLFAPDPACGEGKVSAPQAACGEGKISAPHELPPEWKSPDTLCLNKIRNYVGETGEVSYICESLIERDSEHRIVLSEVSVFAGKVKAFHIISNFAISGAETAMKLERPEFITVYELHLDMDRAVEVLNKRYISAMQRDTDVGRLYLKFNDNNQHMKSQVYRLNDDVNGMIYVTDEGQLILAAYSLRLIHKLEREASGWPISGALVPSAKYEFKEDVFYDFVRSDSGDFIHFVNNVCDFDPDDM